MIEVVSFTGTLTNTGKYGKPGMCLGNIINKFHHVHSLTDTGTAKQANLATFGKRTDQIDDLDTRFQQFGRRTQFGKFRGLAMNAPFFFCFDRTFFINGLTQDVHNPSKCFLTNGNRNRVIGVFNRQATSQPIS